MKSLGRRSEGARLERMKASPLWDGERFHNVHPITPGLRDPGASMPAISEFLCGGERRVPRAPLPSVNPLEAWNKLPGSGLRVTWLGHSTVLIEIDGVRVLTDPVWDCARRHRAWPAQSASSPCRLPFVRCRRSTSWSCRTTTMTISTTRPFASSPNATCRS
jgi:hypothetical protein